MERWRTAMTLQGAASLRSVGRRGWSESPSWSLTGVAHPRRRSVTHRRATQPHEPLVRSAARERVARRAAGWDWTASSGWARVRLSAAHQSSTADDYGYGRQTTKNLREPPWRTPRGRGGQTDCALSCTRLVGRGV